MKHLPDGNEAKYKREWSSCHEEMEFNWNKYQEEQNIQWNSCQTGMKQNPRENEVVAIKEWKFNWNTYQEEWNISWNSCQTGMRQNSRENARKNKILNEELVVDEWTDILSHQREEWDKNETFVGWNEAVSAATCNETGTMNQLKFISFHSWKLLKSSADRSHVYMI